LEFTENSLEKADRRRAVKVCLFDILVVELGDKAFDVDQVAFDFKLSRLVDRTTVIVNFNELKGRMWDLVLAGRET
jgi:hypothetical protein